MLLEICMAGKRKIETDRKMKNNANYLPDYVAERLNM